MKISHNFFYLTTCTIIQTTNFRDLHLTHVYLCASKPMLSKALINTNQICSVMKKSYLRLQVIAFALICVTAGAQIQIGTQTQYRRIPIHPNASYSYSQVIYLQSEINTQMTITGLQFYYQGNSLSNSNDWTIYMGHTSKNTFASTGDWIPVAELTEVWSGVFTDPGASGWISFDINAFAYNNSDNLVIAVDENAPGSNSGLNYFHSSFSGSYSSNRSIYYNGNTIVDPADPPLAENYQPYIANIILIYDAAYASSTTTQISRPVGAGKQNQPVIRVEVDVVDVNAKTSPIVTQFTVNANGSSTPLTTNIENARIFYTGNSDIFSSGNQFGSTFGFTDESDFTIAGNQAMILGTNYFWLTFDVKPGAAAGDVIDAECISLMVDGDIEIPDITAPSGNRVISGPLAGTYTISAGADHETFSDAAADLNNLGIDGAVTFLVNPGIYTEQIWLKEVAGASAQNTITFKSSTENPEDVVLQFEPQSHTMNWVVHLEGASHITFQEITIQNIGNSEYGKVFHLSGINNAIIIAGNILNGRDIDFPLAWNEKKDYTIIYGDNGEAHLCNYAVIQNNIFNGGSHAVNLRGWDNQYVEKENQIIGNTINGFCSGGIHLAYQDTPTISQNTITGKQNCTSSNEGILIMDIKNSLSVTQNQVFLTSVQENYGIQIWYSESDAATPGLIANNYVCVTKTNLIEGIGIMDCANQYVYHNTIRMLESVGTTPPVKSGGMGGFQIDYYNLGASLGNNQLFNNIVSAEDMVAVISANNNAVQQGYFTANNNCYYTAAPFFARVGFNPLYTLNDWQKLGFDADSELLDPGYQSVINPAPTNPLLEEFSPFIPEVPYDLFGNPRKKAGVTPGAVELETTVNQTISWQPTVGNDWHNPDNWNPPKVPDKNDNVHIPDKVGYPPVIGGNAECNDLNINAGTQLNMANGATLDIHGSLWQGFGDRIKTVEGSSAQVNFKGNQASSIGSTPKRTMTIEDQPVHFVIAKTEDVAVIFQTDLIAQSLTLESGMIDFDHHDVTIYQNLDLSGGNAVKCNNVFFIGSASATYTSGGNSLKGLIIEKDNNGYVTQMDNMSVDSLLIISGKYKVNEGLMVNTSTGMEIREGGSLEAMGTIENVVVLDGSEWYLDIHDGAGFYAECCEFRNMDENGVHIQPGVIIDEGGWFNNCAFYAGTDGGVMLTMNNGQDMVIDGAAFYSSGKTNIINVRKSVDAGSVTFINEKGDLAGENLEDDPFDRIFWSDGLQNQFIILDSGWSGISSYLVPDNPEFDLLMDAIKDQLIIIRDYDGNFYQPAKTNSITEWDFKKGYFIKMASSETLEVSGIFPLDKELNLMEGWNLFPVLSHTNVSIQDYFRDKLSKVEIVTEVAGIRVYWPDEEIITLHELVPGEAYLAKAHEAFTLFELPSVITSEVTNIEATKATCGGDVNDGGYLPVINRGVVWSTNETPTLNDNEGLTNEGGGEGAFVSYLSGLQPQTTYYVCAYATNSVGTAYGEILSFSTTGCEPPTVEAGENVTLCEMADAFMPIPSVSNVGEVLWSTSGDGTFSDPQELFPVYFFGNGDYSTGGVTLSISAYAPEPCQGFATDDVEIEFVRLPSVDAGDDLTFCYDVDIEITATATNYSEIEWKTINGTGTMVNADQLTLKYEPSSQDWFIGFTDFVVYAYPQSPCDAAAESFIRIFHNEMPVAEAGNDQLYIYGPSTILEANDPPDGGFGEWSMVGTFGSFADASDPNTEFSGLDGYIFELVWTVYDENGCNDSDTVRVFFIPAPVNGEPCPLSATVTDPGGNVYQTVQMGGQCWMSENYKLAVPGSTCYEDNPIYCEAYGRLYDWHTIMSGASASNSIPSGVQGICPPGWHIPSDEEWFMLNGFLIDYSSNNYANLAKSCRQVNSPLGGSCNTTIHPRWDEHPSVYGTDDFNFSALPGGMLYYNPPPYSSSYTQLGYRGLWWTTAEHSSIPGRGIYLTIASGSFTIQWGAYEKEHMLSLRCVKDGESKPTINTAQPESVQPNSAISGGNILESGGLPVTGRGVVWSDTPNPTINNNLGKTNEGIGSGKFTSNLSNLQPESTYYFRAYATNGFGTAYGEEFMITTPAEYFAPTVVYHSVMNLTATTARSGGTITDDGGSDVHTRGVMWSTLPFAIADFQGITVDGSGPGVYQSDITGLTPETTYYLRAYAINDAGIGYSDVLVFETPEPGTGEPCSGINSLVDPRDGKTYDVVAVADRCWMAENLAYLPQVHKLEQQSDEDPRFYVNGYKGNSVEEAKATANYEHYGVLYNWPAALTACPDGWRLATKDDWTALENEISGGFLNGGSQLKSCRDVFSPYGAGCQTSEHPRWDSWEFAVGHQHGTDDYGFAGLPAGMIGYYSHSMFISSPGKGADWWSATPVNNESGWIMSLSNNNSNTWIHSQSKTDGLSIRCIKE